MTKDNHKQIVILMADDDPDDCLLARDAITENGITNNLFFVHDGIELLDYLRHNGQFADAQKSPTPDLILLDLNMPKKDGREALSEIRSDPDLKSFPIVILSTSKSEEDILSAYRLGANAFITKPVSFDELVEGMRIIGRYWFDLVALPKRTQTLSR